MMQDPQQPSIAQRCQMEIDEILKKYNCELAYQEVYRNGILLASQIMVIQRATLIKPTNGEKIFKIQ